MYVVWEWQGEHSFLPYSAECSAALERSLTTGVNELRLGTVDACLEPFKVVISAMVQVTEYNGVQRPIRRSTVDSGHPFVLGVRWEWQLLYDTWLPYGIRENQELESQHIRGTRSFNLSSLPRYKIDLSNMIQINTGTKFKRNVRRVACSPYRCQVGLNPTAPPAEQPTINPAQQPTNNYAQQATNNYMQYATIAPARKPTNNPAQQPAINPAQQPTANNAQQPTIKPDPGAPYRAAQSGANQMGTPKRSKPGPSHTSQIKPDPDRKVGSLPGALVAILAQACTPWRSAQGDSCSVCREEMVEEAGYDTYLPGIIPPRLSLACKHHLHNQCLQAMLSASTDSSSFRCPECQKRYGTQTGNQPISGRMAVKLDSSIRLAGYEQYGTVVVTYSFNSGTENGVSFTASNFPRTAYFPDTNKGNEVVDLMKVAFERRLVFTIGTSVTTGQQNTIVWNDIHHKTSLDRGNPYGYPDPGYLDRVVAELKSKGVELQST